jgi:hypothetical protein
MTREVPEQEVEIRATITLSLPMTWDRRRIARLVRAGLQNALADHLAPRWNGKSPIQFTVHEEAELYAPDEPKPSQAKRARKGGCRCR